MNSGRRKMTFEEFVRRARARHANRYSYPEVVFTGSKTRIVAVCPEHGHFRQTASNHLTGKGCPKCSKAAAWETRKKPVKPDRQAPFGALGGLYSLPFWS